MQDTLTEELTHDSLLVAVRAGINTNALLRRKFFPGAGSYVRALDKMLGDLRVQGRLKYAHGKWIDGDLQPCPTCKGSGKVAR
jgi:hypothetical protein